MITASAAILSAASLQSPAPVVLVVRSDLRTGRLVRGMARQARPAEKANPQIELPDAPETAPRAITTLVDTIAERHEVDRDLVHSMIRVESNYNPLAVSSKGALGLMQLVPSTARRFGVVDVFNPAQNVEGGVRYLKYLLDHYDGNRSLALAAYNAGEGTVQRYHGVPPFPETQDYVYRVAKAWDQSKQAKQQRDADSSVEPQDGFNPIRAFMDAMGRIYYKTQ